MPPPIYKHTIVGFGIAGQLLALELLKKVQPNEILILDSNFLGGALATEYGTVISNTPWFKTKKALQHYPEFSAEAIQEGDRKYQEADCMPVGDIAKYCLLTAKHATRQVEKITGTVQRISPAGDQVEVWHSFGSLKTQTVFICTGAKQKILDFDLPQIPLSIALDKTQLERFVDSKDNVAVFGTAHSGTIVVSNLNDFGVKTTAIYNGVEPFRFARNGAYDGIKEGSEKIAEQILLGAYSKLTLIPLSDISAVHKHLKRATKAIYCTGFESSLPQHVDPTYNAQTAEVGTIPGVYGYGIAFPGKTMIDGKDYIDVSVLSFQEQIQRTLPAILEKSNR